MHIDGTAVNYLLPELLLVMFAVFVFIGGTFNPTRIGWTYLSIGAFAFAAIVSGRVQLDAVTSWGSIVSDPLAQQLRFGAIVLGVLFCMFASQSRQRDLYPELIGSLVLVFVGLMLVCAAHDMVTLFIGLELISIPTYVLLFIGRSDRESEEATGKYFMLSILASAMMLYGFATLYGMSGELEFSAIQASFAAEDPLLFPGLYPLAVGLILMGFCFKIAAVPFQFYAPDVYQATTNLNAALLAIVPKIAGVVGLVRLFVTCFPHSSDFVWQLIVVLAVLTMTYGNVAALWQGHLRRMMAYSSIAHAGYLMIGLAAAMGSATSTISGRDAVAAMLFYVMAYAVATIGAFAALGYLSDDDQQYSQIRELAGVGRRHPMIGALLAICMFSLAGIPPLAGFWGKFALFRSALDVALGGSATNPWFLALCVLGVLNAAIAAAYYLRVIAAVYFQSEDPEREHERVVGNTGAGLAALVSVGIVLWIGIFAGRFLEDAARAADVVTLTEQEGAFPRVAVVQPDAAFESRPQ